MMSGRYGPYVKWGKVNATLPSGKPPEETTLEEAIVLIGARRGKGKPRNRVAAKKPVAKAAKSEARPSKPVKPAARTVKRNKKTAAPDKVSA